MKFTLIKSGRNILLLKKKIYQGSRLGDTCLSTIVEWGHSMSDEEYDKCYSEHEGVRL